MNGEAAPALARAVAGRYRSGGRFSYHYVLGKLRRDPLTAALLARGPLGRVLDLGCGRGQFALLLLLSGQAERVIGLDGNASLLQVARQAGEGLAFETSVADFEADRPLPACDTVLIADVLYQLSSEAQTALLARAAAAPRLLIRTTDPAPGWRAALGQGLERAFRRVWPHSGARVNPVPPCSIVAPLKARGFACSIEPCRRGTPFANVLIEAKLRPPAARAGMRGVPDAVLG